MVTALATIIVLGILIFVHEFGHFLVARLCGVRVLVFSIGFGPEIVGFVGNMVHNHARLAIAIVAAAALIGWWIWRVRKKSGKGDGTG